MDFVGARKLNKEHRELTREIRRLRRRVKDFTDAIVSASNANDFNRTHQLRQQRDLAVADLEKVERAASAIQTEAIRAGW